MAIETITITAKSELKVSKNKRTYFTIGDEKGRTFVCFKPALYSDLEVGTAYPMDFDEPKQEGDSFRLNDITTKKKPEEAKPPQRQYPFKDSESIERQVAVKEIGEDWRNNHRSNDDLLVKARNAWLVEKMGSYYEATNIHKEIKRTKAEVPKLTMTMEWLSESIKKIWSVKPTNSFAEFLINRYNIEKAKGIDLMLKQLTTPQEADLCGEITKMLEKLNKTN